MRLLGQKCPNLQIWIQALLYFSEEFQDETITVDDGSIALFRADRLRF